MGAFSKFWQRVDTITGFADKSVLPDIPPNYSRLSDGTDSYNYETTRHGLFSFLGFGDSYFKPQQNLKWYYENVPFFADCINLYADIASQVRIQEVNAKGDIVENSEIVKLLNQPNEWQDGIAFIKEAVINILCSGVNVMYGDFFKNGNLRMRPSLYNLDFFNLQMPKVKNPYKLTRKEIQELKFKEQLEGNETRTLQYFELAFIYDQIAKNTYSDKGFSSSKFLDPISRVFSIRKDLQILTNTADTMAFLSSRNVNWIVSKKNNNGEFAPLQDGEKMDIEAKLSGNGMYGSRIGKSDVIATNEELSLANLTRDNRKMQMIEMQNNAKENIRSRFGISRDLIDAYTGTARGSTYENQQFTEASFTITNVKNITDSMLYGIEKKVPESFTKRGHKLIGTYDHMPSIIAINGKLKNEGFKAKSEALLKFFEAFEKAKALNLELNYNDFLIDNGFEQFIKTQATE